MFITDADKSTDSSREVINKKHKELLVTVKNCCQKKKKENNNSENHTTNVLFLDTSQCSDGRPQDVNILGRIRKKLHAVSSSFPNPQPCPVGFLSPSLSVINIHQGAVVRQWQRPVSCRVVKDVPVQNKRAWTTPHRRHHHRLRRLLKQLREKWNFPFSTSNKKLRESTIFKVDRQLSLDESPSHFHLRLSKL